MSQDQLYDLVFEAFCSGARYAAGGYWGEPAKNYAREVVYGDKNAWGIVGKGKSEGSTVEVGSIGDNCNYQEDTYRRNILMKTTEYGGGMPE